MINVQILQMYSMEFPAVTFCNMNPIKASALAVSPEVQDLLGGKTNDRKKRALGKMFFFSSIAT